MTTSPLVIELPSEVEPYRNDIRRFVDAMVYKLRKNAHKGRWEGLDQTEVLNLLQDEVNELQGAVAEKNTVEVLLEAADVANFAMMSASLAVEQEFHGTVNASRTAPFEPQEMGAGPYVTNTDSFRSHLESVQNIFKNGS